MRSVVFALALLLTPIVAKAQTMTDTDLSHRLQVIEDRAAIRTIVDTFSNLADTKEIDKQVLLFTPDAMVTSYANGQQTAALKGRQQIGDVFKNFLAQFETVYHMNGQQTVEINGDTAKGVAYCLVVLVGHQDGKLVRNTMGVTYHDEFVRQDGTWLIANRTSNFVWHSSEPVLDEPSASSHR